MLPMSFDRHHQMILVGLLLTLNLAHLVTGQPHSWADNVCNESFPIQKDIIVEQPVQYEIKVQSMCGILPCVKTRLETRTDQTIKTIIQHTIKLTCCPGYVETPSRRCAPVCSEPCGPGGKCVEPNVCKCQSEPSRSIPGFTGSTCRRFVCLSENRWGAACERECQANCTTNSYCSADTGKCICEPGWHGPNCDLECGPDDLQSSGCNFMSQMPPIVEPDANLLMANDNMVSSRTQKAEALIFTNEASDDDVKIRPNSMDETRAWASFASSYLISLLSVMSIILLVAFLIVKKRYEFVRNELYHASVASIGGGGRSSGGSTGYGPGSEYSTSTYYSTGREPASDAAIGAKNLESNLSFAAATRNILSGSLSNQADGKKVLLFSPKTESHLIKSQEASKQNIYSEIDLSRDKSIIANRARAETPKVTRRSHNDEDDDANHIYQVPKRSPLMGADSSKAGLVSDEPLLRPNDVSVDLGYDNDSNIYEEIKPREGGSRGNL